MNVCWIVIVEHYTAASNCAFAGYCHIGTTWKSSNGIAVNVCWIVIVENNTATSNCAFAGYCHIGTT